MDLAQGFHTQMLGVALRAMHCPSHLLQQRQECGPGATEVEGWLSALRFSR